MKALIHYEFRKTRTAKLIVLGITLVLELGFLLGIAVGEGSRWAADLMGTTAVFLVLAAMAGTMFIGIQSVVTLHRDMNTKQGYMLYMTPRNSYQILGAKVLENGLSLLLAGAAFFLLGLLDVTLLFSRVGELEKLWEAARQFMQMLGSEVEINVQGVAALVFSMLCSWLATISIAYLADILSSALLNGKKFNGLISFLFFVLLSLLMSWLQRLIAPTNLASVSTLMIQAVTALVYATGMYFAAAYLMDHYLSV